MEGRELTGESECCCWKVLVQPKANHYQKIREDDAPRPCKSALHLICAGHLQSQSLRATVWTWRSKHHSSSEVSCILYACAWASAANLTEVEPLKKLSLKI